MGNGSAVAVRPLLSVPITVCRDLSCLSDLLPKAVWPGLVCVACLSVCLSVCMSQFETLTDISAACVVEGRMDGWDGRTRRTVAMTDRFDASSGIDTACQSVRMSGWIGRIAYMGGACRVVSYRCSDT